MQPLVQAEIIVIPNKKDLRLAAIAESQRQANEIARKRNAKTASNRAKYAKSKQH